jgi:hypothetical protein
MEDEVLLVIGNNRVMMTAEEAFKVCEIINGSSRIATQWYSKHGKSGNLDVIQPPSIESFTAYVVPLTGHLRITLDANEKTLKGD